MSGIRSVRLCGFVVVSAIFGSLWIAGSIHPLAIQDALSAYMGLDPVHEFTRNSAAAESAIHVELTEPARVNYGTTLSRRNDMQYVPIVEREGYTYEASLAQAAREVAYFYRDTRRLAPSGVLAFLLDSSGATFWGVRQTVVVTTGDRQESIKALLDPADDQENEWLMGIGEVAVDGSSSLKIMVGLSAKRTVEFEPTPRRYVTGETIALRGRIHSEHTDLFALAMGPAGAVESLKINSRNGRFSGYLTAAPGEWVVELIGTSGSGPIPLAQLTLHVDQAIPKTYSDVWPPHESRLANPAQYMLKLINRDRRLASLPPLKRRPSLDEVAVGHSSDMKMNRFVGHVSPSTGNVGDRLNTQGVSRVAHGENVALNNSVTDAHYGLMRSLGHRRNLLSPGFTEVGIGLISSREGWYVTQVFSRPTATQAAAERARPRRTQRDSKLSRYGALAKR